MPAGTPHAYKIEEAARMLGVLTGGFERFFQHMGTVTDHGTKDQPPFIPDFPRMKAAAMQHNMQFMPDFQWPDPESDVLKTSFAAPKACVTCWSTSRIARISPWRILVRARPADATAGARCTAAAGPPDRRVASGFWPAFRMPRSPGSGRWSWISGSRPASDSSFPVVVFLHGGGWRLGSRHSAGPGLRER